MNHLIFSGSRGVQLDICDTSGYLDLLQRPKFTH
jgi:hypothetical protein